MRWPKEVRENKLPTHGSQQSSLVLSASSHQGGEMRNRTL